MAELEIPNTLPGDLQPPGQLGFTPLILGPTVPMMSMEYLTSLAEHYNQGLAEVSPGTTSIASTLSNGREAELRRSLAVREAQVLAQRRSEAAQRYMSSRPAGTPVSPQEIQMIYELTGNQANEALAGDPGTIIERITARNTSSLVSTQNSEARQQLTARHAEQVEGAAQRYQFLTDYAQNRLHELLAQHAASGWGEYTADMIGQLNSPLQWYRLYGTGALPSTSYLPGDSVHQQSEAYFSNPNVEDATRALSETINTLRGQNLQTAIQYLTQFVSGSTYDRAMQNIGLFLDVAPGVGWVPYAGLSYGLYRGGRRLVAGAPTPPVPPAAVAPGLPGGPVMTTAQEAAQQAHAVAVGQTTHAAIINRGSVSPAPVIEASGDIFTAAAHTARQQLSDRMAVTHGGEITPPLQEFGTYARSWFNPDSLFGTGTRISNELAQRVVTNLNNTAELLTNTLFNAPLRIDRLTRGGRAEALAAREAWETAINHQYNHLADRVLDVGVTTPRVLSAYPPVLRPYAAEIILSEQAIGASNRMAGLRHYMSLWSRLQLITDELRAIIVKPGMRPRNRTDDVLFRAAERVAKREKRDELATLSARGRQLEREISRIPPADLAMFERFNNAHQGWEKAQQALRASGELPELQAMRGPPSGFYAPANATPGDIRIIYGAGNVPHIEFKIGDKGAQLFESRPQATITGQWDYGLKNFTVEQQGTGYYIRVLKPIDETSPSVRHQMGLDLKETPRPSVVDWFTNYVIRGGNRKVDKATAQDLKVATYGSNGTYDEVARLVRRDILGNINMSGQAQKEFHKFIEHQRAYYDVKTQERGIFSKNQMEFEQMWHDIHGRYPDQHATQAYWSYVQINNMDKLLMDLAIYRDKARVGLENHSLRMVDGDIILEGKVHSVLPVAAARHENAGFLVWSPEVSGFQHIYINRPGGLKSIEDLQNKGYKVVQITHFAEQRLGDNPQIAARLDDIGAAYAAQGRGAATRPGVDFVLTRNLSSQPLPFQQTPNKAGGHHQYAFESLIRQPDIRGSRYYGDTTLRGFEHNADAHYFLPRYEEARKIMNQVIDGKGAIPESRLANYLKANLPESVSEFKALFNRGRFDRHTPFLATRSGENTWKAHKLEDVYPGIKNQLDSQLNMYNTSTLRYALERGETPMTIARRGTTENPVYNLQSAKMVDALPTMDRAINHLIRNSNFADVQIKNVERYIAEFGDVLKGTRESLYRDPLDTLINGVFRESADPQVVAAARNFRSTMMENLRLRTDGDRIADYYRQKTSDYIYQTLGQKPFEYQTNGLIKAITHPISALKNAVYYYNLIHPWQTAVQAAGVAHIAALYSTREALEAMSAATLGRVVRDFTGAKGLLGEVATRLGKLGWKREDFMEAYAAGTRTGYFKVGRESALADSLQHTNDTVQQGIVSKGLNAGMVFYRKGDEFVRHATWYAAYRRWRNENPGALLDDVNIGRVLNEADRLNVWMSSFGMTSAQRGVGGVPSAFWSYNLRMMEQMFDVGENKLTWGQLGRVGFVYTTLYGLPTAAAAGGAWGASAWVRNWILEQRGKEEGGHLIPNPNQRSLLGDIAVNLEDGTRTGGPAMQMASYAWQFIMNGVLQAGLNVATQRERGSKESGIDVAIGERFGPGGNRFFSELFSDHNIFSLLTGATGTAARDIALATNPFLVFLADMARPANERTGARIGFEEVQNVIGAYSGRAVSSAIKAYWAMAIGEYQNSQGMRTDRISQAEALIFTLTGLHPSRIDTAFGILDNQESLRQLQALHTRSIQQNFRNMMSALTREDYVEANRLMARNRVELMLGRFTPSQVSVIYRRLMTENGSTVENAFRRYGSGGGAQNEFYRAFVRAQEGRRY